LAKEKVTSVNLSAQSVTVISTLLALTACGAVDPSGGLPAGDAQLAVLNALEPGLVATLDLDGVALELPATGVRISRVIPAGSHRIEARAPGGQVLSSASFTVAEGGRRTAILGGAAVGGTAALVVGADTASIPPNDAAKLRVVHTVQGVPALEAWLYPVGEPVDSSARLVSPFDYGVGASGLFPGYVVRPIGSYRIRVTSLATGAVAADQPIALGGGEVWSVVLTRESDGELHLVPIREN
jgi:hypothetical protein